MAHRDASWSRSHPPHQLGPSSTLSWGTSTKRSSTVQSLRSHAIYLLTFLSALNPIPSTRATRDFRHARIAVCKRADDPSGFQISGHQCAKPMICPIMPDGRAPFRKHPKRCASLDRRDHPLREIRWKDRAGLAPDGCNETTHDSGQIHRATPEARERLCECSRRSSAR